MRIQGAASRARQSGLSRWAWLVWLAGAGLFVIWLIPYGNPTSPVDLQPYGTLVTGDIPTSKLTLHWTQGGIVRSLRGPSPGRADRFVVCFYQGNATHDCAAGSGLITRVEAEARTIARRELPSGDRFDRLQSWLSPRYDYDFPVALPEAVLDVALGWTVGACSTAEDASCTFAAEQALTLTARDLAVQRIDDEVQFDPAHKATGVAIALELRNDGRTSNEPMHLETRVWEILRDGSSDDPLLDPAGVPADHVVITRRGEEIAINAFDPARDEILGIHPPNGLRRILARDVSNPPPPKPPGSPLLAGSCNAPGVFPPDPCNAVSASVAACEPEPCIIARPGHAALFAVYAEVNPGRVPWDFDPSDNSASKSGVRVP